MSDRSPWSIALATANLTVLVAAAWIVGSRLDHVERQTDKCVAALEKGAGRRDAAADRPADRAADKAEPPAGTLAALEKKVGKLSDDAYDQYSETMGDLHELKRTSKQVLAAVRSLAQAIAKPGQPIGAWGLAAPAKAATPPTPEVLAAYRDAALAAGVKVEPGRVEVRGFLNMSPNAAMPIEYFVTRWPESGHETLVHVLGPVVMDDELTPDRLKGVVTGVYKGLVAAGFVEGQNSGYEAGPNPDKPTWVPPTGDTVYVGVRYSLHGKVHVARATDWVIDPAARSVLAPDCFRFAGSRRQDDFETGDEQLTSEAGGLVVSVYRNPTSMIEIAAPSNLNDNYRYNDARIPKPLIAVLGKHEAHLDMIRDRLDGSLRVLAIEKDGKSAPVAKAPVLLMKRESGAIDEIPFAKATDAEGGFVVRDARLKTSPEWRVRVEVDGQPVETTGFDPLYVDLILSKTPIVPEGDGALPIEPVPAEPAPEAPANGGEPKDAPPGGK